MPEKTPAVAASEIQRCILNQLSLILAPCAEIFDLKVNSDVRIELWTAHQYRTISAHPNWRTGQLFAGVMINKSSVSLYLMALDVLPGYSEQIDQKLGIYRSTKTVFRFSEILDPDTTNAMRLLLERTSKLYMKKGWLGRKALSKYGWPGE